MIFCSEINSQVTMKIHRSFDLFLNMLSSFGSEPFKLYRVSFAKHLSDKLFFFFTKYNFCLRYTKKESGTLATSRTFPENLNYYQIALLKLNIVNNLIESQQLFS